MIDKVTAIIPARGGSKRLLGKNITTCAGKPLIAWTIEAALKSKYIDAVYVTTEDKNIADVSKRYGAIVLQRPFSLSEDDSETEDAIQFHIFNGLITKDWLLLLQPTSPCRTEKHIDELMERFDEKQYRSAVSVNCEGDINGAMYLFNKWLFMRTKDLYIKPMFKYPMPMGKSIDVNTQNDIDLAENELW